MKVALASVVLLLAGCLKMEDSGHETPQSPRKESESNETSSEHIHITHSITVETKELVQPLALAQTKDGGYLIAGQQLQLVSAWAMRIDSEARVLWAFTLSKERDIDHATRFVAVVPRPDGSAQLFGYQGPSNPEAFSVYVDAHGTRGPLQQLGNPDRVDATWKAPPGVSPIIVPVHLFPYFPSIVWSVGLNDERNPVVLFPMHERPIGEGSEVLVNERASAKSESMVVDDGTTGRVEGTRLSLRDATVTPISSRRIAGLATLIRPVDNSSKVYVLLDKKQRLELGEYALDGSYRTLAVHAQALSPFTVLRAYRLSNGSLVEFGSAADEPQYLAATRRFSADLSSVELLKSGRENVSGTYGDIIYTGKPNEFIGAYAQLVVSPPAPKARLGVVLDFLQVD